MIKTETSATRNSGNLLYPLICHWTFSLFLCPGYCKQCCREHRGTCELLNYRFLRVYTQEQDCWVMWQFCIQLFKERPYCSPQWLYQFTFPPTVQEDSLFSTSSPAKRAKDTNVRNLWASKNLGILEFQTCQKVLNSSTASLDLYVCKNIQAFLPFIFSSEILIIFNYFGTGQALQQYNIKYNWESLFFS